MGKYLLRFNHGERRRTDQSRYSAPSLSQLQSLRSSSLSLHNSEMFFVGNHVIQTSSYNFSADLSAIQLLESLLFSGMMLQLRYVIMHTTQIMNIYECCASWRHSTRCPHCEYMLLCPSTWRKKLNRSSFYT